MGVARSLLSGGILDRLVNKRPPGYKNQWGQWLYGYQQGGMTPMRTGFDAGGYRRRLRSWMPTQYTTNVILTESGRLLRSRCRDVMRNNPHANAAAESFASNVIGTGIKPSSLYNEDSDLRQGIQSLWNDWTDECDADGLSDFYGMQSIVARSLFESGECFIRFRPREDGLVPLQIQLLESDMCPYEWNMEAPNGNWIMNGVEVDANGKRAAYWFFPTHPGDMPIEPVATLQPVRIPAEEILHIFKRTRPGQVRGVPLITPALVRLFFLDQYDDAELERKRIAAMFAGFITSPNPEDILPVDGIDNTSLQETSACLVWSQGHCKRCCPVRKSHFRRRLTWAAAMRHINIGSSWRSLARWEFHTRSARVICGVQTIRHCAARLSSTGASWNSFSTMSLFFRCAARSGRGGWKRRCWQRRFLSRQACFWCSRSPCSGSNGYRSATIGSIR